jgi:hypothetical protein
VNATGNNNGKAERSALKRSWDREGPRLKADVEEAMKTGTFENETALFRERPDLMNRARSLLRNRVDELSLRLSQDPQARMESGLPVAEELDQLFRVQFVEGMSSIFAEGNVYGVKPAWEGSQQNFAYGGSPGKIVAALRDIRGVDAGAIAIHKNGLIEIPFRPSPLFPQGETIRLMRATVQ